VVHGEQVLEVWKVAFKRLGEMDRDKGLSDEFKHEVLEEIKSEARWSQQFDALNSDLHRPIELDEITEVMHKLKAGKAAGIDTLVNEIFKHGGEGISVATWKLCDELFRLERIPKDWARGLIFPIYKDGDPRSPDNYRGITLLSVVGKIYTSVLNQRIVRCHHVLSEEQAGFRAQRSTVDHIFALTEMLRWRRKRRLQTHCCFLDIRKAYDTLWRDGLWKRLIEVGLRGKMWRVLKNLCEVVESSVLVGAQRTEWFGLDVGLRQGCILSPLLFAIFIDGLTRAVKDTKVRSVLEGMSLNLLLFADDIVLLACSRDELQRLLDVVFEYSVRWRFRFNVAKSKIMHFGLPPIQKVKCLYFLGLQELEIVKTFKYLGVDLTWNLSWAATKRRFILKARSRIPLVTKAVFQGLSVDAGEKVWFSLIRPLLEYAVEVWGGSLWRQAEEVQNAVGKKLLSVSTMTANEIVRGELGWSTLKARRDIRMLKYWGRLLHMEDGRIAKQVYRHCKSNASLKGTWSYYIKKLLSELNLAHLWESEDIGALKDWTALAIACVKRTELACWKGVVVKTKASLLPHVENLSEKGRVSQLGYARGMQKSVDSNEMWNPPPASGSGQVVRDSSGRAAV